MNQEDRDRHDGGATWRRLPKNGSGARLEHVDPLAATAAALDAVDEPVFLLDPEYRIRRVNLAGTVILGLAVDDILGRHCYRLVHGSDAPPEDCPNTPMLIDGRPHEAIISEPRLDAAFSVRCRPLFNGDDRPLGTVHVIRERAEGGLSAEEARRLRRRLAETVRAMGDAAELRDPYTARHQRRVTALALAMAARLGLDESAREGLTFACEVHDIAKIGVPSDILAKPGPLSDSEMAIVRMHVEGSVRLVSGISFEQAVGEIVLQHHERLDGSGYPRSLCAEDLLLEARILAVADVVEAMSSDRPYRRPLGIEAALAEVREGAGTRYDADVVEACGQVIAAGFRFAD